MHLISDFPTASSPPMTMTNAFLSFISFTLEKHEGFSSEKDQEAKGATFWRGAKLFISSDPERSTADFALLQQKIAFVSYISFISFFLTVIFDTLP